MKLRSQELKRLHRLVGGFARGGEPRLGKADAEKRGDHLLFCGKSDGRRLQGREVVVDAKARDAKDRYAGKEDEEGLRPEAPLRPCVRVGRKQASGGQRTDGEAFDEEREPGDDREPGARESADRKERELPEAGERRGEHERIGRDRGEERVQERGPQVHKRACGRFDPARPAAAHQIVGRVVGRDADEAQAHDERDGMERPEDRQRGGRAAERARRDGKQAEEDGPEASEGDEDEDGEEDAGERTETLHVALGLRGRVMAVVENTLPCDGGVGTFGQNGPADVGLGGDPGLEPVARERGHGHAARQQAPGAPVGILCGDPAVVERRHAPALRHHDRTEKKPRIRTPLVAGDACDGTVELAEHPPQVTLCLVPEKSRDGLLVEQSEDVPPHGLKPDPAVRFVHAARKRRDELALPEASDEFVRGAGVRCVLADGPDHAVGDAARGGLSKFSRPYVGGRGRQQIKNVGRKGALRKADDGERKNEKDARGPNQRRQGACGLREPVDEPRPPAHDPLVIVRSSSGRP